MVLGNPKTHLGKHRLQSVGLHRGPRPPSGRFHQHWLRFVKTGGTFSRPHRPGDRTSALGGLSPFKFWIWVVRTAASPPPYPAPGGSHWGGNPPFPAQAAPLVKWAFDLLNRGLSSGFFQDREKTPLRKDSLSLISTPLGKNTNEHSQISVAQFSILFCILGQWEVLFFFCF